MVTVCAHRVRMRIEAKEIGLATISVVKHNIGRVQVEAGLVL